MKKRLLVIAVIVCCSIGAYAQKGFHIGFTSMYHNTWILNQNNFETLDMCPAIAKSELAYRFKFGYSLGASFGYNFNRKYGLQSAIMYNKAGQRYEDTFQPGPTCPSPYNVERIVGLYYLQIPLQFKYKFDAGKRFRMYTLIGPQLGILMRSEEEVIINGIARTDLTPSDQKFAKIDVGATLGLGTEYFITKNIYANLGLVTYYGFTDVNGPKIRDLEWFSKNDVSYQTSNNFRVGLVFGIHYLFGSNNPFKDKSEEPIEPGTTN